MCVPKDTDASTTEFQTESQMDRSNTKRLALAHHRFIVGV